MGKFRLKICFMFAMVLTVVSSTESNYWECTRTSTKSTCKNVTVESCENDLVVIKESEGSVTELSFKESKLTCLPPDIFKKYYNLDELNVMNMFSLKDLQQNHLENAKFLTVLNALGNNLTELPEKLFKNSPKLKEINLKSNQIATIAGDAFEGLNQLTILNLESNQIKNLEKETFLTLTELEDLNLKSNQIETLEAELFKNNGKLKELDLSRNKINAIGPNTFDSVTCKIHLESNVCIKKKSITIEDKKELFECFMTYRIIGMSRKGEIIGQSVDELRKEFQQLNDKVEHKVDRDAFNTKITELSNQQETMSTLQNKTNVNEQKLSEMTEHGQMATFGLLGLVVFNMGLFVIVIVIVGRRRQVVSPISQDVESNHADNYIVKAISDKETDSDESEVKQKKPKKPKNKKKIVISESESSDESDSEEESEYEHKSKAKSKHNKK